MLILGSSDTQTEMADDGTISFSVTPGGALPPLPLTAGITEDYIDCSDSVGLTFHILECGYSDAEQKPLILLLHGYPEVAYSWRKVMPTLASAGNYVVAVDQRGYGRTTGWNNSSYHDTDLQSFSMTQYVMDTVRLVSALGYSSVRCLVGHDMGAAVASMCALMRPEIFTTCVLMSHPFKGSYTFPSEGREEVRHQPHRDPNIVSSLANLDPPRKPYKWYNSEPQAASEWENPEQGMLAFLRGYFHLKSANWKRNQPHPLKSWTADEVAKLPGYYCMPLHLSMPETVAADMQSEDPSASTSWLSDTDLSIYASEWTRTGFQGGLNFYRVHTDPPDPSVRLFANGKIRVPVVFISGDVDWGNHQEPDALSNMQKNCLIYAGFRKVMRAGHWPQQEQPGQVAAYILDFMWKWTKEFREQIMSAPPEPKLGATATSRFGAPRASVAVPPAPPIAERTSIGQLLEEKPTAKARPNRMDTPIELQRKTGNLSTQSSPALSQSVQSPPMQFQSMFQTPSNQSYNYLTTPPKAKRTDTPIEPSGNNFSFRDRGGPALAGDSSNRNNDVYKQLQDERDRKLPARKATPMDDLETEYSNDDEDTNAEERQRKEERVFARFR